MNKILKLILCVLLSIGITYFVISNMSMLPNLIMATDFMKHGTEQDIITYSKNTDSDLKNSLNLPEEKKENKDEDKEDKKEDKEYNSLDELAKDYPMGTTYYSLIMTFGEMQIQVLCLSFIFGTIIGMNVFIFLTDKKRTLKQIIILYLINLFVSIIVAELIQILTLVLAYGTIYFVKVEMQFILVSTATFLFALAMNKTINEKKQQKILEAQEKNSKNVKKDKKKK